MGELAAVLASEGEGLLPKMHPRDPEILLETAPPSFRFYLQVSYFPKSPISSPRLALVKGTGLTKMISCQLVSCPREMKGIGAETKTEMITGSDEETGNAHRLAAVQAQNEEVRSRQMTTLSMTENFPIPGSVEHQARSLARPTIGTPKRGKQHGHIPWMLLTHHPPKLLIPQDLPLRLLGPVQMPVPATPLAGRKEDVVCPLQVLTIQLNAGEMVGDPHRLEVETIVPTGFPTP